MDETLLQQFGFRMALPEEPGYLNLELQPVAHTYYGQGNYASIGKKCFLCESNGVPKCYFIAWDGIDRYSFWDMFAEHYTHIETLEQNIEELIHYFQSDPENFVKPYPFRNEDHILREEIPFDTNDAKEFRSFKENPENAQKCISNCQRHIKSFIRRQIPSVYRSLLGAPINHPTIDTQFFPSDCTNSK
jgi:hypothetical protein